MWDVATASNTVVDVEIFSLIFLSILAAVLFIVGGSGTSFTVIVNVLGKSLNPSLTLILILYDAFVS